MSIKAVNSVSISALTPKSCVAPNYRPGFGLADMPTKDQYNDLRVFYHHIYEYKKGLRSLVLTTEKRKNSLRYKRSKQQKYKCFLWKQRLHKSCINF